MSKQVPIVAIVGRTNAGKSSLFNRMVGFNQAVVAREAGTTRDSVTGKVTYGVHQFWLIDTAGVKDPEDDFELTIQEQIGEALEAADAILIVVAANTPLTDEDRRVAKQAHKSGKPVFLAVNKIDQRKKEDIDEYQRLGIKRMISTAATQNRGVDELLDAITAQLPKRQIKTHDDIIRVALVGRPNVGKSYLFNTLGKKQQAIVANVAGTTRDVNHITINYHQQPIELMDTAGIRRPGKIGVGIEQFSVIRTLKAIEAADICFVLLDANELGVQLDQKLAGMVKESGKGLVLVVSKWDSVEKDAWTHDQLAKRLTQEFVFVPWATLIFTSAVSGQNVTKLLDIITEIAQKRSQKLKTNHLNRWFEKVIDKHPPAGLKNRRPHLKYISQDYDEETPTFIIHGTQTEYLHWSYKRYIERELRAEFDFAGTAIRLVFRNKK